MNAIYLLLLFGIILFGLSYCLSGRDIMAPSVLMCEQMILTIFIIAVTLRAEAKLQVVPVQLRPAADRTFMLRSVLWLHLFHVTFELLSAVNLMRCEPAEPP